MLELARMLALIAYDLRAQGYSWREVADHLDMSPDSARVSAASYAKRYGLPWPLRAGGEPRTVGTIPAILLRFRPDGLVASIGTTHVRPEAFEERRAALLLMGIQLVSMDELVKMTRSW